MVGKEATTGPPPDHRWRTMRDRLLGFSLRGGLSIVLFLVFGTIGWAANPVPQVSTATQNNRVLRASGETVHHWQVGEADAYLLVGNVIMLYDEQQLTADRALLLVDGPPGQIRTRIAAEGVIPASGSASTQQPATATIVTADGPLVNAPRYRGAPSEPIPLFKWIPGFDEASSNAVVPVQYQSPVPIPTPMPEPLSPNEGQLNPPQLTNEGLWGPNAPLSAEYSRVEAMQPGFPDPPVGTPNGSTTGGQQFFVNGGARSVELVVRGTSMPPKLETVNRPEANETVIIARGGVTILVRDVTAEMGSGQVLQLGTVSISAEQIVGWIPLLPKLFSGDSNLAQADGEFYLEGDIVFRQGDRVIYADAMYYNVSKDVGIVLDAEAITSIPNYQGIARLKADVLQQVSRGNFIAFDAAVTSSRMGIPRYWLQSERLQLNDREQFLTDPLTGGTVVDRQPYVTSTNNFVYFGGVPLLYWPTFATSLSAPSFYVKGLKVKSDSVFGQQVMLDFDLLQLLGLRNVPPGIDWTLSTDYLSKRGPALGTNLNYNLPGLFGVPGPVQGNFDAWVIDDSGTDNLGLGRRNLVPEQSTRGRALLRHRQYLPNDFEFVAELGYLSDRNFLEQYFENEWDQDVDQRTGVALNKYYLNNQFSLSANAQVNEYFQETEELPRFDHYLLGSSLLGDRLTYSVHNHVGYSKLNVAEVPTNPIEAANFSTLPGEQAREGLVASTRQEIAWPIQAGVLKMVPFVSGEAARYGEASDSDSLTRLTGQAGIRTSLPMWRVDPSIQSSLLNVRGLAHKIDFVGEYFYADSDTNFDELPLYDSLDDNAQEQFRRRFITDTFGGALPLRFDPRTYALRHGLQSYVTSPSETIADDLQQARVGIHQRFQTKRGLPGRERIVDLLRLDADLTLFPKGDRDNFGETLGPATYDMTYNLGDRVALLSDGYFDFFDDGLRSLSAGIRTSRPGLGDIYLGLLSIEGPVSSTVLRSTLDYRLNEKWILSTGSTYDFGSTGNVGQSIGLTRIGESFLVRIGANVDSGRDNVGFGFMVEPRFFPSKNLGQLGGQLIPPPGVEGLE